MVSPIGSADDLAKQTDIHYGCVQGGASQEFFTVISETDQKSTYS